MNRRGFLAALVAAPLAVLAAIRGAFDKAPEPPHTFTILPDCHLTAAELDQLRAEIADHLTIVGSDSRYWRTIRLDP